MLITTGHLLRLVGALGMAVLGMMTDSPALLVVGSMQMVYQGAPFVRLAQPVTAVRFATIAAVSYTHLTLPTKEDECRSRWSPYH